MKESANPIDELYRLHGKSILRYLQRFVGDAECAQDLLQETFAVAVRRPACIAEATSPRAWLFAVARNMGMNALRRRRRFAALPPHLAANGRSPDARIEEMLQAIANLPDIEREALELRLREDLSYREIATVLKIPVGTVRSRLHRAVQRLRSRLNPVGD